MALSLVMLVNLI